MARIVLREVRIGKAYSIYALENGGCATWEFLNALKQTDEDEYDSVLALLSYSADEGPPRNKQKSRHVGNGVYEFKAKQARICWFYDEGKLIICTHGFAKGSPKLQDEEISSAKKIKNRYFEEKKSCKIQLKKKGEK